MVQTRLLTSAATRIGRPNHPVACASLALVAAEVTRRIRRAGKSIRSGQPTVHALRSWHCAISRSSSAAIRLKRRSAARGDGLLPTVG